LEKFKLKIPDFIDYFGLSAVMTIDFGDAESFLMFDPIKRLIQIVNDDSSILS
jgi:hypothetical protein